MANHHPTTENKGLPLKYTQQINMANPYKTKGMPLKQRRQKAEASRVHSALNKTMQLMS